jgi:Uma2 family endonuclease
MNVAINIPVTRAAEGFDRRPFTVEDVRRMIDAGIMSEEERVELVEGEIVVMASKSYAHENIKNALNIAIVRTLPPEMMMGVETSIQFTDQTILEPDLAVFRRRALIRSDANFCYLAHGDLALAIEVAVSSLSYDKGLKSRLYARYGVREFWVIDANERITWVHTGPTGDGWSSIVERRSNETLTTPALPDFSINLADIG